MKTTLRFLSTTLLLVPAVLLADPGRATAQRAAADGAATVQPLPIPRPPAHLLTVLVPTLDDADARAIVIRRSTVPENVILVTAQTSPAEFLVALRALNRSRRDVGEKPADELRASIRARQAGTSPGETALLQAEEHLARLRAAPAREVAGVGRYPVITTALPVVRR